MRRRFLDLSHPESLNRPMFGLPSLSKLLVLVAIISAIWFGFRLLGQIDRNRREAARREKEQGRVDRAPARQLDGSVRCAVCAASSAHSSNAGAKAARPVKPRHCLTRPGPADMLRCTLGPRHFRMRTVPQWLRHPIPTLA